MALTIISAPGSDTASAYSMHTPLWHVLDSSNFGGPGITDFRYIFDVQVAGMSSPVRLYAYPDASGYGAVDVSKIVRSYVKNYFAPRDVSFSPFTMNTDDIRVTYTVYYGEEYTSGGVITTSPSQLAYAYYAYNAYNFDTPGGSPYEPMAGHQKANFLTLNDANNLWMPKTGNFFLSFNNDPKTNLRIRVSEIPDGVNPPNTPFTSSNLTALKYLLVLNLNPNYINALFGFAAINTDQEGYIIEILESDGSGGFFVDAGATVRWLCEPRTPATAVHFLNSLGGFDTYYFTSPTRKQVEFERKSYEQLPYLSEISTGTVYTETKINYNTRHIWTRRLTSGYVDDTTYGFLCGLIASPQVYIELDGYYYPATIKTSNWSEKLTRFDKMYNLEIEVEMGRRVFSQSR